MAAVSVDTDVAAIGVSRDGVNGGYRGSRERGGYNGYNGRGRGGRSRGRGGRGRGRGGYGNNYNNNNNNNNQQQQSNNNKTNSSNSSSSATSNNNNNNNNNINNNDINNNYDYHDKSDIQCYTCGKWGHYARSCWYSGKKARNESYSAIVDDQVQESQSHPPSSSSHGEIEHGVGNDDYYDDSGLSCMGAGVNVRDLKNTWILDSGATSHHTGNRQLLTNIRKLEEKYKTMTGDGGAVYDQVGESIVYANEDEFKLVDVIYVPTFKVNLISVSKLTEKGCKVSYDSEEAVVMRNGQVIFTAVKENNLYIVKIDKNKTYSENTVTHAFLSDNNVGGGVVSEEDESEISKQTKQKEKYMKELKVFHSKYGHVSYMRLMNIIINNSVDGVSDEFKNKVLLRECVNELTKNECRGCLLGKMSRLRMKGVVDNKVTKQMDMWVVDVMGPMKVETMDGHKYVLVIIDVFTRYLFVKLMKTKGEATTHLLNQIRLSQTQTEMKLKQLHSDGGKELVNGEVSEFLSNNGTNHTQTTPHTPQHNGIVERANRTILEMAKAMLFHCDGYVPLWGEAVMMSAYLLRMSLTSVNERCTPMELWSQSRPSVNHLHVFGCNVYYHIHKVNRDGKLDKHARPAIFIGYDDDNNTYYKVYDADENKFLITRDILFYDNSFTEMKKLKDEVKAHRQSDRLNDDDALPDVLTDEMIQQLFHTDQTTPMTHTNVLNESNASAQIDAHPATNSSVVTSPLMSPSKQNNNQLASRGGRMSKNSNMNRISNDTHERRNV